LGLGIHFSEGLRNIWDGIADCSNSRLKIFLFEQHWCGT
jgi:hypothetical protein